MSAAAAAASALPVAAGAPSDGDAATDPSPDASAMIDALKRKLLQCANELQAAKERLNSKEGELDVEKREHQLTTSKLTALLRKRAAAPPPAAPPREKTKKERWDDARIHPVDAPVGTMRAMLCTLMTDLEPTLKRCASELLWVLCDEQADEFTMRTGFGNAVHMLQLRGIVG